MSFNVGYEDAPAHRQRAEGDRQTRRDQEYVEETYIQRGIGNTGGQQMSLVQRHRDDSADSIEEVARDFPPGIGGYVRRNTTLREGARRASSAGRDRYDDYDATSREPDYYEKKSHRRYNDRREYCTNIISSSTALLNLVGYRCYESSSSSSPKPRGCCKSLDDQAPNALRLGGAAAAAAGHYRSHSRGCRRDRSRDDRRRGHSSSQSSSLSSESRDIGGGGSGLGEIAAGKAIYNCIHSKSQGRVRSSSSSSYHSRNPVHCKRGKSVSDYVNKGLAVVGLKAAADAQDDTRRLSHYEDDCSQNGRPREGGSREVRYQVAASGAVAAQPGKNGNSYSASNFSLTDSELPSSSDEERQLRKMRGKELLTGVLATATTIHAAHIVYKNRKRRHERKKALVEGEISPEEAKKGRNRAMVMDVAFMGIAALGIKSAVTEWKEKKLRKMEIREFRERQQKNHNRRLKNEQGLKNHNDSGRYGGSEPNLNSGYYSGSGYYDGKPYLAGALSPPMPAPPPAPPPVR
jgi:hypothetical protein